MSKTDERAPGEVGCACCGEEHHEREMTDAGHGDNQLYLCESCAEEFSTATGRLIEVNDAMEADDWHVLNAWIDSNKEEEAAITAAKATIHQEARRAADFDRQVKDSLKAGPFPQDPEAEEGMNDKRSGWAEQALRTYAIATGSDLECLVKDLIGDLGHWCDRHGIDLWEQWEDGAGMYAEETERKGEQFDAK